MEVDPTRVAEILVGLGGDVAVLGVEDEPNQPLRVHVRMTSDPEPCDGCGGRVELKDIERVMLVDLPAFGRPTRLVWHKRRWRCRGESPRVWWRLSGSLGIAEG